jgi:hypothetical protein
MNGFLDFVRPLLEQGHARLVARPQVTPADVGPVAAFLATRHADARLDLAGSLIAFDEHEAVAAAERVWHACWFLVNRQEPAEEMARCLPAPDAPDSAAAHLSADLVLRFLPTIHRRSRALAPDDVLTRWCESVLRAWPLSGALADIGDPPFVSCVQAHSLASCDQAHPALEFFDHPGLMLLYAERLAEHPRPSWVPATGTCRQLVELVFAERGLRAPESSTIPQEASR